MPVSLQLGGLVSSSNNIMDYTVIFCVILSCALATRCTRKLIPAVYDMTAVCGHMIFCQLTSVLAVSVVNVLSLRVCVCVCVC